MKKKDKFFLLGSVKIHKPTLKDLMRPLKDKKIGKVFCIECGSMKDVSKEEIFILLIKANEKDMDLYLDGKIDLNKQYIQSNFCQKCINYLIKGRERVKIKNFPKE